MQDCRVSECGRTAESLPESLAFLDIDLCEGHVARLLAVHRSAQTAGVGASYVQQAVLREAQTLLYPPEDGPVLRALEGGAA